LVAESLSDFELLDQSIARLEAFGSTVGPAQRREVNSAKRDVQRAGRSIRKRLEKQSDTVLGEGRRKRLDVFGAEWDRGLELVVSTKTLALAADERKKLLKNLPNRWEEFDGDLKNLRGRFPLAAMGALILVPDQTVGPALDAVVDMMTKLTAPDRPWVNAYTAASVLVTKWSDDHVEILNEKLTSKIPEALQPEVFFTDLISSVLDRSPLDVHTGARKEALAARGGDVAALEAAAQAEAAAVEQQDDDG
jgi:hypothetical protein